MTQFVLYRQQREDGGRRTGLEINGSVVWDDYDAGKYDDDPTLRWYVDLRGEGDSIPSDRDSLRDWLLQQAGAIESACEVLAKRFEAGIDIPFWPLIIELPDSPEGAVLSMAIHMTRRVDALDAPRILDEFGRSFSQFLRRIPQPVTAL